jgi:hypothetical protein
MATNVYEYPFGTVPCFRIDGHFVYDVGGLGDKPAYEIKGPFWYAFQSGLGAKPEFQVRGPLIYEYPVGTTAAYQIK